MFVIKKTREGIFSLPSKEIKNNQIRALSSDLAYEIIKKISEIPSYPKELARKLKVNEQKVYYHIRNLEKSGIIEVTKKENMHGTIANYYKLVEPSFVIKFKEFETTNQIKEINDFSENFLYPFINQGKLNTKIIVGSPDPHGQEKARSRDGYYGIDLALFLGTFLNYPPELSVKLDTEVHSEDLQENLIILGGPIINTITAKINNKLPIKFDKKNNWSIVSSISNETYYTDETGVIVKMKNPFNNRKQILLVAGKRHSGTKAAIISFLKYFNEISKGNKYDNKIHAKVVEGIDLDSDGVVDDVKILE